MAASNILEGEDIPSATSFTKNPRALPNDVSAPVNPELAAFMNQYTSSMLPGMTNQQQIDYMRANPDAANKIQSGMWQAAQEKFNPDSTFSKIAGALALAGVAVPLAGVALGPALGAGAATTGAETAGLAASEALPAAAGELEAVTSFAPAITGGSALAGAGGVLGGLYDTGSLQASNVSQGVSTDGPNNLGNYTSTAPRVAPVSGGAIPTTGASTAAAIAAGSGSPEISNTPFNPNYKFNLNDYTPSNLTSRYLMANGASPTAAKLGGAGVTAGLLAASSGGGGSAPATGYNYGNSSGYSSGYSMPANNPQNLSNYYSSGQYNQPSSGYGQASGKGPSTGSPQATGKGPSTGSPQATGKGPSTSAPQATGKGPSSGGSQATGKGPLSGGSQTSLSGGPQATGKGPSTGVGYGAPMGYGSMTGYGGYPSGNYMSYQPGGSNYIPIQNAGQILSGVNDLPGSSMNPNYTPPPAPPTNPYQYMYGAPRFAAGGHVRSTADQKAIAAMIHLLAQSPEFGAMLRDADVSNIPQQPGRRP